MKLPIVKADPLSIEIPKKPPGKSASEHRRATKPIMEKRRRARINNSLEQIKTLILLAKNKDPAKHSKLEKADILEMTVEFLKDLNKPQPIDESSAIKSYQAGFDECASEVKKFVEFVPDMDLAMKRRLKSRLNSNFQSLNIVNLNSLNKSNNNNFVSSTTSSRSSTGHLSPVLSPLNMKSEPIESLTLNRDALTTISFNFNNLHESHQQLTPPSSANSQEVFSFPPNPSHNQYQFNRNYNLSPISTQSSIDDGMDCTPVDCSKSSKLNFENEVWRPW